MKQASVIVSLFALTACSSQDAETARLQLRMDSLQHKIENTYKPGFGEFMSGIQVHHEKLWFAGRAANWSLADFEMGELGEAFESIKQYCTDRPETRSISIIEPALDSVRLSIKNKDTGQFRNSFLVLTQSCNNCHGATNYEFNVIKIPDVPPFSNQVFNLQ